MRVQLRQTVFTLLGQRVAALRSIGHKKRERQVWADRAAGGGDAPFLQVHTPHTSICSYPSVHTPLFIPVTGVYR